MSEESNIEFGSRVRALRTERGLSLSQFQLVTGLHWSYLSSLERGKRNPTLNSMLLVSYGLGVDLSTMVKNLPRPNPPVKRPRDARKRAGGQRLADDDQSLPEAM